MKNYLTKNQESNPKFEIIQFQMEDMQSIPNRLKSWANFPPFFCPPHFFQIIGLRLSIIQNRIIYNPEKSRFYIISFSVPIFNNQSQSIYNNFLQIIGLILSIIQNWIIHKKEKSRLYIICPKLMHALRSPLTSFLDILKLIFNLEFPEYTLTPANKVNSTWQLR